MPFPGQTGARPGRARFHRCVQPSARFAAFALGKAEPPSAPPGSMSAALLTRRPEAAVRRSALRPSTHRSARKTP